MALSERERRFVDAYMGAAAGNGTEAARLAGYAGKAETLKVQASRLLTKANVQAAIAERRAALESQAIADQRELHTFWTSTMRNGDVPWKDRLKASELHGKANAMFTEKHQHLGADGQPLVTRVIHEFTEATDA